MNINCIVDVASREVSFQDTYRIASYDHNVDVIHFSIEPIEGFSLDTSTIRIAAQGPNNVRHDYAVDPSTVAIEEETGYITFDWPIPAGVTEMPIGTFKYGDRGRLIFAVCAEIIDGSTVSKAWHSDDGIITVVAHLEPESGGGEDPEEEATNAQKIGQLQTATAILQREINGIASGTPPTASSTSEMDPDESTVYINTTDGNWYHYDGSAWQIGGQYGGAVTSTTFNQHGVPADDFAVGEALADKADDDDVTALGTRVTSVEGDVSDLKEDIETNFHINGNVKPNLIAGSFVDATSNNIGQSDNFSMTEPIAVKKWQKVTLTARGYNAVVGMIATCNADNTERVTVVASVDSNEHDYIYNVTEDGYIVCSFNHGYDHKIAVSIDYYSELENVKSSNDTIENSLDFVYAGTEQIELSVYANGFVDATNNKYNSGGNFNTTNSVHLFKGQTINLTATGYRNVVGMINLYDSVNDRYQTVVRSADNVTEYSYTATSECDVRMCYLISAGASANIVTSETDSVRLQTAEAEIDELKATPLEKVEYPQMFTNIICIGDSLTRGESGGSQSVQLSTNYPFYFEKLTGATCYNAGLSGRTTKQWWDEFGSTITGFANYDCAVIYLGTNGGLTDTVDTDCNGSDYTQNADTNTGCYGKIIGKIKADAPNCKIFCVAGPSEYLNRDSTMNPAVRHLASFYDVGLIDLSGCLMDDNGTTKSVERYLYRPIDGIHYNRLGYMTLASMIYDYMSDFMSKHLTMYDD